MRLIDSEPPLKEIRRLKEKANTFEHPAYKLGYISALSVVEGLIASEDKIDAEPVRHGRWKFIPPTEETEGMYICTACESVSYRKVRHFRFRPYCGAKMDEEVQHAEDNKE